MTFIIKIETSTLKFIWKCKSLQTAKAIHSKKGNAGGITISDFKLYYKPIAYCHIIKQHDTDTKTDMKTSGTEKRTWVGVHTTTPTLFLTKMPKIYNGEKTSYSTNVAGKSGYLSARN
jgi:hypothetical protein